MDQKGNWFLLPTPDENEICFLRKLKRLIKNKHFIVILRKLQQVVRLSGSMMLIITQRV